MIKVCAHYCGTTILLKEFETEAEAKEFMKYDFVFVDECEPDVCHGDDLVYTDEMFIVDGEIPFCEPPNALEIEDELPF